MSLLPARVRAVTTLALGAVSALGLLLPSFGSRTLILAVLAIVLAAALALFPTLSHLRRGGVLAAALALTGAAFAPQLPGSLLLGSVIAALALGLVSLFANIRLEIEAA